jgi:hypothetical protein
MCCLSAQRFTESRICEDFIQSMEKAFLLVGLHILTFSGFVKHFKQSMEKVSLPSGLQNLKFGTNFN